MRKNKDKAWAEFDINPSDVNFSYASSKQQTYEVAEVKAKVNYEKKITSNLKQNCKSFYSYLRNKRQVKSSVVSLEVLEVGGLFWSWRASRGGLPV